MSIKLYAGLFRIALSDRRLLLAEVQPEKTTPVAVCSEGFHALVPLCCSVQYRRTRWKVPTFQSFQRLNILTSPRCVGQVSVICDPKLVDLDLAPGTAVHCQSSSGYSITQVWVAK